MASRLIDISIKNLGCIGPEGLTVGLDNILCLVGNNNSGKSTVLRAYELAVGTESYDLPKDKCVYADGDSEVEITVHIPDGVGNIAEKWKVHKGDLRIVRSKWTWGSDGKKERWTYDPETEDYSEDGNAAGLDSVFQSRLPKPFRVGALVGPDQELKKMLQLIVEPLGKKLSKTLEDKESALSKALKTFNDEALKPIEEGADQINVHSSDITASHSSIFPHLEIKVNVGLNEMKFDPIKALAEGSTLDVKEYDNLVKWNQQGTGSQRALFWSLLQVRSKLQTSIDLIAEQEKQVKAAKGKVKTLEKQRDNAKTEPTKLQKQQEIDLLTVELQKLETTDPDTLTSDSDVALPGYMLLIDEPEIALHPNGIRSACKYLYELANDSSWQVMLTTHSPLFVDPFRDNTTIVRLTRTKNSPSPKTYRSDEIKFSTEEKEQLTLLNSFDQNLSEMFFGQQPVIIEGDTEFAAFQRTMEMNTDKYPLSKRPLLIRARGKFTILPVMKMLDHFKVDYSVLHDSDYPKNKNGDKNGVWNGNEQITELIKAHRQTGIKVVHRISISTFEIAMKGADVDDDGNVKLPSPKGKPYEFYMAVKEDEELRGKVETLIDELINPNARPEPFEDKSAEDLNDVFKTWVDESGIKDSRFTVDD